MMISNYNLVDDSLRGIELYFMELINQLIVEESHLTENCGACATFFSGFLSHRATPSSHPVYFRIFHWKSSIWGTPMT
jgi:hypothetical protein